MLNLTDGITDVILKTASKPQNMSDKIQFWDIFFRILSFNTFSLSFVPVIHSSPTPSYAA